MKKLLLIIFLLTIRYAADAQLIRGPYLQAATSTSMVIRWRTDVPMPSLIRYGTNLQHLDKKTESSQAVSEHEFKLEGLQPATRYYYAVGDGTREYQGGESSFFQTLPVAGQPGKYLFGVLGDCGTNSAIQGKTRDQLSKLTGGNYMNALLLLGDNAYSFGYDHEYQSNFFNHYQGNLLKQSPLFPSPGNHDYHNDHPDRQKDHKVPYYDIFTMPTQGESGGVASENEAFYSFDYGNVHFLSLDSYGIEDNASRMYDTTGRQAMWVKKDLAANRNKEWIVAYWHHPPYTLGTHNSDQEAELTKIRENFIRILERNGVDLIICGHSHVYERSRLMQGHYDKTTTFNPAVHNVSQSSGRYDGADQSCPYVKSSESTKGTVYVVVGSSGHLGAVYPGFPQKAMVYSDKDNGGGMLIQVEGNRLDAKWVTTEGDVKDQFTMEKNVNKKTSVSLANGNSTELKASFSGTYEWSNGASTRQVSVSPKVDTRYIVRDTQHCLADTFDVKVAGLPTVVLSSFQATVDPVNTVKLTWQSATEPQLAGYALERSTDGNNFSEVAKVTPKGPSTYEYADKLGDKFYTGEKLHYRLRFSYTDGRTGVSNPTTVTLNTLPPAILTRFNIHSDNENKVALSWQTSYERGTTQFFIERSFNKGGVTDVGNVPAAGQSLIPKDYNFTDPTSHTLPGTDSLYYRLQVSLPSGKVLLSDWKGIKLDHIILSAPEAQLPGVEIAPNPAFKEDIGIRLTDRDRAPAHLSVIDQAGRVLSTRSLQLTRSFTPFLHGALRPGIYFVKVDINGASVTHKFVIQ